MERHEENADLKLKNLGELIELIPQLNRRVRKLTKEILHAEKLIKELPGRIADTGYGNSFLGEAANGMLTNGSISWCKTEFPHQVDTIAEYAQKIFALNQTVNELKRAETELGGYNLKLGG